MGLSLPLIQSLFAWVLFILAYIVVFHFNRFLSRMARLLFLFLVAEFVKFSQCFVQLLTFWPTLYQQSATQRHTTRTVVGNWFFDPGPIHPQSYQSLCFLLFGPVAFVLGKALFARAHGSLGQLMTSAIRFLCHFYFGFGSSEVCQWLWIRPIITTISNK